MFEKKEPNFTLHLYHYGTNKNVCHSGNIKINAIIKRKVETYLSVLKVSS